MPEDVPPQIPAPFAPAQQASAVGDAIAQQPSRERVPVSSGYIWLLLFAAFGGFAALVAPIGISLSLRVQELAPENVEVLGFVVGAGAAIAAISQPLVGMWSDRTRSRFGRRRPFALGGAVVGLAGLAGMAAAPDVPLLTAAWMVTQLGFGTAIGSLLLSQADRLPEFQRGRVAGLYGLVQMVSSVAGVGLASAFIGNDWLVFLAPGALGLVGYALWFLFNGESSNRDEPLPEKLTATRVLQDMVFNPRKYPDFAWNWLGRLLFNVGVTFATTFTTLFFASRLSDSGQVSEIGGIITILSLLGVVATAVGALGGGFLSDRIKRRRLFVLVSAFAYTSGAVVMAFGGSNLAVLVAGSMLTSLGLGIFSAVDQAIVLDVLPEQDTAAGRFLGINNYATSVAQAAAPVIAAPLLLIGVTGAEKNYSLLFIFAAACTLIGGLIVTLKVKGTR